MPSNLIRLSEAGHREKQWALHLVNSGITPINITYQDLLDRAMYDASRDAIIITYAGAPRSFKVNRP